MITDVHARSFFLAKEKERISAVYAEDQEIREALVSQIDDQLERARLPATKTSILDGYLSFQSWTLAPTLPLDPGE